MLTRIPIEKKVKGQRTHIPAWLSNPDGVAPCLCGTPMQPGQPHIVGTSEDGLKRWFHGVCWQMMMEMGDEEDYDEDEWDWEDEDE